MKGLKYAVMSLALLACLDATSAIRKNRKAKKSVTENTDTCSVDTFSYAYGMSNTQGLKNFLVGRMGVDTTYMAKFIEGFTADKSEEFCKEMQAYVAGLQIRQQVENDMLPKINKQITDNDSTEIINESLFMQAFVASLSGQPTEISPKRAKEIVEKQLKYYHDSNMEKKYGDNRRAGEDFLKKNKKKKGVVTLPSGLQYKVLTKGDGEIPEKNSRVKVNYEGRLIDGTVFDSSYKRNEPAVFGCNQVIKGWTEALTMMPTGSKWEIYIPQELAYGERNAGTIKPFSALVFTVELIGIEK